MEWHSKSFKEVLEKFGVDPKRGLTDDNVIPMREKYGSNNVITLKPKPVWLLLLEQF